MFNAGDTVKLKSGGPVMTVRDTPDAHNSTYTCQWFAGRKLESGRFQEASLVAAAADDA